MRRQCNKHIRQGILLREEPSTPAYWLLPANRQEVRLGILTLSHNKTESQVAVKEDKPKPCDAY